MDEACTACSGDGWYYVHGWPDYPRRQCPVCADLRAALASPGGRRTVDVEAACEVMHDAYEEAASQTGWSTNLLSRRPWALVPEANRSTMRIAVKALLTYLAASPGEES